MDEALFSGIVTGGVIVGFLLILCILCFIGTKIDEKYEAEEARRMSIEGSFRTFGKTRHGSQSPLVKKCEPSVYTIGGDNPGFEQERHVNGSVHRNGVSNGVHKSPLCRTNGVLDNNNVDPDKLIVNGVNGVNGIDSSKPRAKSMRETTNGDVHHGKFMKSHSVQGDYYTADILVKETTFGVQVETVQGKVNGLSPLRNLPNRPNGLANNSNGNIPKANSFEREPIPEEIPLSPVTTDCPEFDDCAFNPSSKDNNGLPHRPRKTRRKYETPYSNQNTDVLL